MWNVRNDQRAREQESGVVYDDHLAGEWGDRAETVLHIYTLWSSTRSAGPPANLLGLSSSIHKIRKFLSHVGHYPSIIHSG